MPGRFPAWRDAFGAADHALTVIPLRADRPPRRIDFVAGLDLPQGFRPSAHGAQAVFSLGAGVERLLARVGDDPVPVVRLRHPEIARRMTEHVVWTVLALHRRLPEYLEQRRRRVWRTLEQPATSTRRVVVLGYGELGRAAAAALRGFGFPVTGWRRSPDPGDPACVGGPDALGPAVAAADILVALLPQTPATTGLIDRALLDRLPPGAAVVSCGRGVTLDDLAVAEMVAAGRLSGAALDVFGAEPPARDHPAWRDPRILMTPHAASVLPIRETVEAIVCEIGRWRAGSPFANVVPRDRGY